MTARVDAVCVSGPDPLPLPGRRPDRSGIHESPVPGRVAVGALGLDGDVQVDRRYHGGEGQAVYAYAQEDADFWIPELGREPAPGQKYRLPQLAPALFFLPVKDQAKVVAKIDARAVHG